MNLLIDFYKRTGKTPQDYLKFREPLLSDELLAVWNMPPTEQLKYLREKAKNLKITINWDDLDSDAHTKAFTVAKILSADVLQDVYNYVDEAVQNGESFEQFKEKAVNDGLIERMQSAGWTGESPSRLKVIFNTNCQMAYSQGNHKTLMSNTDIKPYWRYTQLERPTKRHSHSQFHNKTFRYDDAIWSSIYPPSGFSCGCQVTAVRDRGQDINSGEEFKDILKENSNDFNISPLKAFEPDTTKYVEGIKSQLEELLKLK